MVAPKALLAVDWLDEGVAIGADGAVECLELVWTEGVEPTALTSPSSLRGSARVYDPEGTYDPAIDSNDLVVTADALRKPASLFYLHY